MVKVMETQPKCFLFPLFPQSTGLSAVGHSGGNNGRSAAGGDSSGLGDGGGNDGDIGGTEDGGWLESTSGIFLSLIHI